MATARLEVHQMMQKQDQTRLGNSSSVDDISCEQSHQYITERVYFCFTYICEISHNRHKIVF